MAKKILLTQIPSVADALYHQDELKTLLQQNEQANFEQEVAELLDTCIRAIIKNMQEPNQNKQLYIPLEGYTQAVHEVASHRLQAQGWQAAVTYCHLQNIYTPHLFISEPQENHMSESFIPTPEVLKNERRLSLCPVNIFNVAGVEWQKATLINRIIQGIESYRNNNTNAGSIDIERNDISNCVIDDVAQILRNKGWDIYVKHAEDSPASATERLRSPNQAKIASLKIFRIILDA